MLELKALALTLSEAFHRGQLLHNTGTSATNDLINWTTEITEPREIRVLSILLPDLTDTAELLELSSTWDTTSLVERNLLITAGPWKRTNKTTHVLPNKKLPEQGPYHHLSGTSQALG